MSKQRKFNLVLRPKQTPSNNENNGNVAPNASSSVATDISKKYDNVDLREKLAKELSYERYECMICYDKVKKKDRIWSCEVCWACFHMSCVKDWSTTSTSNLTLQEMHANKGWRCPGCQNATKAMPRTYTCFCGKTKEPRLRKDILVHSCGTQCKRRKICGHYCTDSCHPGPCSDCILTSDPFLCACGKNSLTLPCSELKDADFKPFCGFACQKTLQCGLHFCEKGCHAGDCMSCDKTITVTCKCCKENKDVSCSGGQKSFSCQKECGQLFDCQLHPCTVVCHEHIPGLCPLDPSIISTCYCGSVSLGRQSCSDPIPTCNEICGKVLECAEHPCPQKCHSGACPPCAKMVSMGCRCKKTTIMLPCSEAQSSNPILCRRVCQYKYSCKGRHVCNEPCCSKKKEEHRECERLCAKKLSCKLHNCLMACSHEGRCHDCVEGVSFDELSCGCGRSIMYPPIPCNTPPPSCNFPCQRRRECGHLNATMHYCHSLDSECPPCMIFRPVPCACGSEVFPNIPCSRKNPPSCGKVCQKKILNCGHLCKRACHGGDCADSSNSCSSLCLSDRSCGHECQYKCHGTSECKEEEICKQSKIISCLCGLKKKPIICGANKEKVSLFEKASLDCDEACAKKLRATQMAAALKIDINASSSLQQLFVGWPEPLVKSAASFLALVIQIEKILEGLVGDFKTAYYYFPKQRLSKANFIINGMVEAYGFLSEWVDENVGKGTVIARRVPGRNPSTPGKLLSEVAKNYNPLDPYRDSFIQKPLEALSLDQAWRPNGILVDNIHANSLLQVIAKILIRNLSSSQRNNLQLFWLNDSDFFVQWENVDDQAVADTVMAEQDLPAVEKLLVDLKAQDCGENIGITLVSVTPIGGLINADGAILARAKDRKLDSRVDEEESANLDGSSTGDQWMEVKAPVKKTWKRHLIDLSTLL